MERKAKKKAGPSWATAAGSAGKSWKKAREVEDTGGGGIPDIDDGSYVCKFKSVTPGVWAAKPAKKNKKGKIIAKATPATPYLRLGFVVVEGRFKGTKLSLTLSFSSESQQEFASTQLQRLMADDQELPENVKDIPAFVTGLLKEFKEQGLEVKIAVKNKEYKGKAQLAVYVNEVIEGGSADEDEDDSDEDEDSEDDEDSKDDDSDDSEDDESDEDDSEDEDEDSDEDDSNDDEDSEDDEDEDSEDSDDDEDESEDDEDEDSDSDEDENSEEDDDEGDEPEDVGFDVDDSVSFTYRKKKLTGNVEKMNYAKRLAHVQVEGSAKPNIVDFDDLKKVAKPKKAKSTRGAKVKPAAKKKPITKKAPAKKKPAAKKKSSRR